MRVFGAPARISGPLAEALRAAISASSAELVTSTELKEAEKRLQLPKRGRNRNEAVLRGAAEAGATQILIVRLKRSGGRYHATIEFFDVGSDEPRSKGTLRWDRSPASAKRLADRLMMALMKPLFEPPAEPEPQPEPEPLTETSTASVAEPEPEPEPTPPPALTTSPEPESPTRPSRPNVSIGSDPERGSGSKRPEHLRLVLGAGSGILHNYRLSNGAGITSGLSFELVPSALFGAEAELRWPWPMLGLWARAALSPVRYQVTVEGVLREQPGGYLLDGATQLRLHLSLSEVLSFIPALGVRFGLARVDEHRGNFILSQTTLAPEAAVGLRFVPNPHWELNVSLSGAYLLLLRESPVNSGAPGPGVVAGGHLDARWWITPGFGLAADAHFDLLRASMTGAPSRQIPEGEVIDGASLTTLDLRVQLGVALRL